MKKSHTLIALAMLAALTMTGCKNNKKSQEPTKEEIQVQKQALADTVLAKIDELENEYRNATSSTFDISRFELTDAEKLVKPDYLLDPLEASRLVTRSQKVNALGIYIMDRGMMKIYDMPADEISETIAKLFIEISANDYSECFKIDGPFSEKTKAFYAKAKECGELPLFWQFQNAVFVEGSYLLANDPDLFYSRITEDQWQYFRSCWSAIHEAVNTLANYDDEMTALRDLATQYDPHSSREEDKQVNCTKESSRKFHADNKDKYTARRNALLQ